MFVTSYHAITAGEFLAMLLLCAASCGVYAGMFDIMGYYSGLSNANSTPSSPFHLLCSFLFNMKEVGEIDNSQPRNFSRQYLMAHCLNQGSLSKALTTA